jgi:hypothetical protein
MMSGQSLSHYHIPGKLIGTERGIIPFLSPDDRWVGFWAGGTLILISATVVRLRAYLGT